MVLWDILGPRLLWPWTGHLSMALGPMARCSSPPMGLGRLDGRACPALMLPSLNPLKESLTCSQGRSGESQGLWDKQGAQSGLGKLAWNEEV